MTEEDEDVFYPSYAAVRSFDMVEPMIVAAHQEMSELSKKKQDGVLNELKVRHINRLLTTAQESLAGSPSLPFLELLDDTSLPQNSDAVLVLGQWLAAMRQFKKEHQVYDSGHQVWFTQEDADEAEEWDAEDSS
jgi:hypothetical protein